MDAITIAKKIADGTISSEKIVHTYIEHIQHRENEINAIVEKRFDLALLEAKQVDEQRHQNGEQRGPLCGVPISVKESFDVKQMKTTGGLHHRKKYIPNHDAYVVKKLKEAGAIVLCKTNTPALCFCQETNNKLYGRTNNPWGVTRTAGGSSGGEGALLAIGGAAAGIGSDIGGSIRFPSHMNGVVGFKPGKFQVSSEGHFPADDIPLQRRMSSMGPMGKSVRDMKLIYNIIANNPATEQTLDNMIIQFLPDEQPYPISYKTRETLLAIRAFLRTSFQIEQQIPPYFTDSAVLWQEMMSVEGSKTVKELTFDGKGNVITTYLKEMLTKRTDIHKYLSWALIGSTLFKPSRKRVQEINTIMNEGDQQLSDYFSNRLLIIPVYHTGALKHGKLYKEVFSIRKTFKKYMPYVAYANVWGLPSLTIPVSVDDNNMPIGVQIISTNGNEGAIFSLGKILEKQFRGYIRNESFDKKNT